MTVDTSEGAGTTAEDRREDGLPDVVDLLDVPGLVDFAGAEPGRRAGLSRLDEDDLDGPDEAELRSLDQQEELREPGGQRHSLLHALVVIVTDREEPDQSGELVAELLAEEDFMVDAVLTVESRKSAVRQALETAVVGGADLVITVGGTGVGPRDRTPEATKGVLDRRIPGMAQALRASALACNAVDGGLSRGLAGVSGSTVVVNLAGSRSAIRDGMATLCPLVRHVIGELNQA
ncbi:MogA/MoaB family molybdenum cofactor biosynthesis protein [Corynebacterium nuruki]|uniref:MogA/MoaB family molybdenum cofactor biosynthesis protein n=1 Tax=Corynebacterium nuruki TaxID=1032851 RepID=UPI0039BFA631